MAKEISLSSCTVDIPNPQKCDAGLSFGDETFCRISVINLTIAEDFTSGFETEIGILKFEFETRGDISWLGLEPVTLDYMISNLPTSQCHVFTEPHVITFDQHRFDFYGTGTFLMAKNEIDGFEVKKYLNSCPSFDGPEQAPFSPNKKFHVSTYIVYLLSADVHILYDGFAVSYQLS